MLEAGVPGKVVQEMLGHRTLAMTMDTYSHVMPGMRHHPVAALDRLTRPNGDADPPQIEGQ